MSSAVPSRKSPLNSSQGASESQADYASYLGSAESIQKRIDELSQELKELQQEHARLQKFHGEGSLKSDPVDLKVLPFQKEILMLTKAMPHMVWLADSEGKCFQANERYYEFTGITEQEDDGWSWMRVMHPEDLPRVTEMGAHAADTRKPLVTEFRYLSKDGEYQWHYLYCIPYVDPDTLTTKWFGTTTNIHERKQAIEVLKQSEEHFKILSDAIPQIVFAAGPDGKVNFWNSRWFEYSGFTEEQAQSDAWQLLIHPNDREKYIDEWNSALQSGDSLECVFRMKRAVGVKQSDKSSYRKHLARVVALRDSSGEITKWFGTWTEIEHP
ncbi:MAG: PAS domain-containing protein [Cyanobacteria bacterium TGS_CYA1]|nr:PAS domain-containing protein [Cyanobacteria bacterium TGS_CYA1]